MKRTRRPLRTAVATALVACVVGHASAQQMYLSTSVAGAGAAAMSRGNVALAGTCGQTLTGRTVPGAVRGAWGFWYTLSERVSAVELARAAGGSVSMRLAPNPATAHARLDLVLPRRGHVRIRLVDLMGNVVAILADRPFESGPQSVEIPLGALPSASYVVELLQDSERASLVLSVVQ